MTATTTTAPALIAEVRAYAVEHYNDGGWDVIVETFSDDELAAAIGGARTLGGALRKLRPSVSVWADRDAEARAEADAAREPAPEAAPAGPTRREQVAALAATATAAEIAQATGLSIPGVRHHLRSLGITAVSPDRAATVSPHRDRIAQLAADGCTAQQIADQTGLSVPGVRHHLKAAGITAAPADRTAAASPKREQVAALLGDGKPVREIASALGLSIPGTRYHVKAIRQAQAA